MLRILPPPTRRLPEACPFAEETFDRKRKGEEGRTVTSHDNIRNRQRTAKNGKQRKHTARKKKRGTFFKKRRKSAATGYLVKTKAGQRAAVVF